MKKYLAAGTVLAALLLAGLYFLHQRGSNAYRSLIPSDARGVAVLNTKELLKAADLSLRDMLAILHSEADEQTGLRLFRPVYGFVMPGGAKGVAASVSSKRKLEKWLSEHGGTIESNDGIQWCAMSDWLLAFDKRRLLAMYSSGGETESALRQRMSGMFSEDSMESPLLAQAEEQQGIMGAAGFLDNALLRQTGFPQRFIPNFLDRDEVMQCASLSIEENALKLNTSVLTDNNSLNDILDAVYEVASPLTADLPMLQPDHPAFSVRMNLDGESLLPLLRQHPKLRTVLLALNLVFDADMMIRSIAGDVQLAIPEFPSEETEWLLTAALSDTDFLSNLSDWLSGSVSSFMEFRALSKTDFYLNAADISVYFGVRNGRLYVTPSSVLSGIACIENPQAESQHYVLPGSRLYAQCDASTLIRLLGSSDSTSEVFAPISSLLSITDHLTLNVCEGTRAELRVNCHQPLSEWLKSILLP